jgi:hypothetical protein
VEGFFAGRVTVGAERKFFAGRIFAVKPQPEASGLSKTHLLAVIFGGILVN